MSPGFTLETYVEGEHRWCFQDEFVMTDEDVPSHVQSKVDESLFKGLVEGADIIRTKKQIISDKVSLKMPMIFVSNYSLKKAEAISNRFNVIKATKRKNFCCYLINVIF